MANVLVKSVIEPILPAFNVSSSFRVSPSSAAPATPENLTTFLKLVADGKQDEVEAMLKANPTLALAKGDVTDHANRIFKNITAFQYAVWALDWDMWKMLLNEKYLTQDAARIQAQEFETGSWVATHGKHAGQTIQTLIDALKTYIDNYHSWSSVKKYKDHWLHEVGGAQRLLPMCVLHEYCNPKRLSEEFIEDLLPRTLNYYDFTVSKEQILNLPDLGSNFGLVFSCAGVYGRDVPSEANMPDVTTVKLDHDSCVWLLDVKTNQRAELIYILTHEAKLASTCSSKM